MVPEGVGGGRKARVALQIHCTASWLEKRSQEKLGLVDSFLERLLMSARHSLTLENLTNLTMCSCKSIIRGLCLLKLKLMLKIPSKIPSEMAETNLIM